jgi:hypothetical protein
MAKQELYEYEVRNNADIETPHTNQISFVKTGMDIRDITKQIYLFIYLLGGVFGWSYFIFRSLIPPFA